jgi:hypothetical protein
MEGGGDGVKQQITAYRFEITDVRCEAR